MLLTSKEKDQLKNPNASSKVLGNLYYHIRQKIKKRLIELAEINNLLNEYPKTRSALNDEAVASVLKLTENMLQYLEYVPIKRGRSGEHIIRSRPKKLRSTESSAEFIVKVEAPTSVDFMREAILKDHIEKLYGLGIIDPKLIQELHYWDEKTDILLLEPAGTIANVNYRDKNAFQDGYRKYKELTTRK